MNFSTNQVIQFFDVTGATVAVKTILDKVNGKTVAVAVNVGSDRSDFIKPENILHTNYTKASEQKLQTKAVLVALNSAVNGGAPVAGQDYVLTLTYSGHIGNEDTYHKFASVHATSGMTAAQFYLALAKDMLVQQGVEYEKLYELKTADGTVITSDNITENLVKDGFYICEPIPDWELGAVPETLMNISLATNTIKVSGIETKQWLANYEFAGVADVSTELYNTHKIADLEYFALGEKGLSAGLVGWPDNIKPNLKVDASAALGYDIYTVHFAYVGANASNQKSEKDLVFVEKVVTEGTATTNISTIKAAIEALLT